MTVTLAAHGSVEQAPKEAGQQRQAAAAARQFEGVLLQQVLRVLWKTAPGLAGKQGDMYRQLFEGPFAEHLANAGGIGLAPMLERALGVEQKSAALTTVHQANGAGAIPGADIAPIGEPGTGELAQLQGAAQDLLRGGGASWSKDGTLSPQELSSGFATPDAAGGEARFSVRDARGYQGYYKCNLFAFELARRAGFEVPLTPRDHGWGYPSADRVATDARDKSLDGGWAKVVTGESADHLDASIKDGSRALMLAGSASGDRHGHMAVVERVRSVEYDSSGAVSRIIFDGWEARPEGASHLRNRTWNAGDRSGGNLPHDGFERIEILELKHPSPGARNELPLATDAPASRLDESGSRDVGARPISSLEDRS